MKHPKQYEDKAEGEKAAHQGRDFNLSWEKCSSPTQVEVSDPTAHKRLLLLPSAFLDDNPDLKHVKLFFHLIPIVGFFPSLWTLYSRQGNREQQSISRLSVTLAGTWLLGYLLLITGAKTEDFLTLRLLLLSSLLSSGYFLVSFWLMVRLWQRKSPRLPGFSRFAERFLGKHLS